MLVPHGQLLHQIIHHRLVEIAQARLEVMAEVQIIAHRLHQAEVAGIVALLRQAQALHLAGEVVVALHHQVVVAQEEVAVGVLPQEGVHHQVAHVAQDN